MAKLKIKPKQRGGYRPGAGRPRGPLTVPMSIRVLPETQVQIQQRAMLAGVSYGGYVDHIVELTRPPHSAVEKQLKKG
jgi:hypothetical protein